MGAALSDPNNASQLGLAAGLLQAGGPSRMPVSLGQALGQGLQNSQQFLGGSLQNQQQLLNYNKQIAAQQYFQGLNNPQQGDAQSSGGQPTDLPPQPQADASQAPAVLGTAAASADNGLGSQPVPTSKLPAKLPQIMDPTKDAHYQDLGVQAQRAKYFGLDDAPLLAQQSAYLDYLKNQEVTLTPDQTKLLIPGGAVPGQAIKYKPYSGDWSTGGTEAIKTTSDPVTGQPILMNVATGKPVIATAMRAPGQALPGPYEKVAEGVANYDLKPPTSGSGRGAAYAANILSRAQEINPDFNAQNYDVSLKAAKDFSTGKQGQGVKSFNVALKHLDTLSNLADAMGNGDIPAINKLANTWKTQTGGSAPTSFNAAKQIVGDEIVKAIVGSGGGVADRETAAATINAASSPAQLKQVIQSYKSLMVGQLEGLRQQYETTTFRKDFDKFLSPEAKTVMQNSGQQQAPQGGAPMTATNPSTGQKLTSTDGGATWH